MSKKEEAERQKLAQELCERDGYDWDALDDYGKHSYGHYADVVIRKGLQVPEAMMVPLVQGVPLDQCLSCYGKGFTEEEDGLIQIECADCGGTGKIKAIEPMEIPNDDSNASGTEPDNQPTGGKDTSEPKQPSKSKSKKKT